MYAVNCVVVGAGIIGLAVARALAIKGQEVLILEKADTFGTEISSRNSEVIHAGIYYDKDSFMARFCVEGRDDLYKFCEDYGVPHSRCGKFIVAVNDEESKKLAAIKARAKANGVEDIEEIDGPTARRLEPALSCVSALHSPSTGVIDSHSYMLSLLGDAEANGAVLSVKSQVHRGKVDASGITLHIGDSKPTILKCKLCINAAGLDAISVANKMEGFPQNFVPPAYFAKGSYFSLTGRSPFSRLIYPVPVPGGLGTHLTLDLAGNARFGPDIEWVDKIDYSVDPRRALNFYASIRRYWPGLRDGSLHPSYSGIRPKIVPPNVAHQDFLIQGPAQHGISGMINLFGIESPGLTASLAIAKYVAGLAGEILK